MFAGWITFSADAGGRRHGRPGPGADARQRPDLRARADARRPQAGGPLLAAQTLTRAAAHFDHDGEVETQVVCVDQKRQWSKWRNVWHSSASARRCTRSELPARAVKRRSRAIARLPEAAPRRRRRRRGPERARGGDRAGRAPVARSPSSRARTTVGGGARSEELTLPGFVHDTCSTVHALARLSPFLRRLPAGSSTGSSWCSRRAAGASARRRVGGDARALGGGDGARARPRRARLSPALRAARRATPTRSSSRAPRTAAPAAPSARCWRASASAGSARPRGSRDRASRRPRAGAVRRGARALDAAARRSRSSAAFGIVLAISAPRVGWPVPRGGSQRLADALASHLRSLGGRDRDRARVDVARRAAAAPAPCCST